MLPSSFYAPTPTTPIIPVHGTFGDELTIERVQRQLHIWKLEDGVGLDRSSVGLWFSGMFDDPDEESLRYWLRAQEEKRAREEARARRSTRYRLIALAGSLTTVVIFLVTVFLAGLL
jgi:hypothetical protein